MAVIAITGGTGFVGKRLIDLALSRGQTVRALTRRAQSPVEGITWIEGSLDDAASLTRLATGADAIVHVAGVVNAPSPAAFLRGNAAGTAQVIDATRSADVRRFIHVSSLAAREPQLSHYGHSKARAEAAVQASALDWTIVRPPAVYGPGDMEMRDVFRLARMGLALLPPPGRLSIMHVDDLARLLLALAEHDPGRMIIEPDDGVAGGWTHAEFARAVGVAVGRKVLPVALPKPLLATAAGLDALFRRSHAKLTRDRVNYLSHHDWVADPSRQPSPDLWLPAIATRDGLAETVDWYRAAGLLR